MNLLVLGRGKTGSLVAEIARERGHRVRAAGAAENRGGCALTREALTGIEAVIDFTTPDAVLENIRACAAAGVNLVVGTTGWYARLDEVRRLVERSGIGFVYAANFSIGVNLFLEIARTATAAAGNGYAFAIEERHHLHKKDAPSGTALVIQRALREASRVPIEPEITSVREGEIVGTHIITAHSPHDTITLMHEAHSRRGFAEGAVKAAEWIAGKRGFFEFADLLREKRS